MEFRAHIILWNWCPHSHFSFDFLKTSIVHMHMIALIAMNLPLDARIRFLKHLAYGDYFLLLPNFIHFIVEISLRFLSSTKINGSKNMLISLHDFVVFDFILFGQHCKVLCVHSQRIFEVEDENFWHYHKIPPIFFLLWHNMEIQNWSAFVCSVKRFVCISLNNKRE